MASHCMAGGWRAVYDAADPPIDTMLVDVAWDDPCARLPAFVGIQGRYASPLDMWDDPCARLPAFVAGRGGRILSPTAGPGTFAELLSRPPSDRLGPTPFGEGASSSRPRRAAVLDGAPAPVNDIGVYTVLLYRRCLTTTPPPPPARPGGSRPPPRS